MAKLSDYDKKLLIADYHTNKYSQRELAKKYDTSIGTVNNLTKEITPQNGQINKDNFIDFFGLDNCILHFLIEDIKKESLLINDIVEDMQKCFQLIIRKKEEMQDLKLLYVLFNMNISEIELISIINAIDDSRTKNSHTNGEQKVKDFLDKNKIEYKSEYIFENLPKKRFDFYIDSKKICIEFDGRQHFEPIDFFGGNDSFEKTQKSDNEKNSFCQLNKIKLIRIPYFDFHRINDILLLGLK